MKDSLKSYILNLGLIVGLTAFGLWFALKDNFNEVMQILQSLSWITIVFIFFIGSLYGVVTGCVLTIIARKNKKDYKWRQGIANGFIGLFFSGITPSATGGQFGQAYIFKKQGINYKDAASILWMDFIIYQTMMMIYVTILFFLRFKHFLNIIGPWFLAIIVGYVINACVILVLWTMALCPKLYVTLSSFAVKVLFKLHIVKDKEKTLNSWTGSVQAFTSEIKEMSHEKKLILKAAGLCIVRMTILFSMPYVIMNLLGMSIGINHFIDCLALSSFVLMANAFIPLPGASGGTEVIFTELYKTIIPSAASASGIMILWRFSTFHVLLIIGAILFIALKRYYARRAWHGELEE